MKDCSVAKMDKQMVSDSKYLSYLLRHKPSEVNCDIDEYGWVDIDTLCRNSKFTLSYLEAIVEADTRYEFNPHKSKIRAFHGHSVEGVHPFVIADVHNYIYHGTSLENYAKIKESGCIMSMSRNFVHLSKDETVAKAVGSRHGKPVILVIDCEKMQEDGYRIYHSGDGVFLVSKVPLKYVIDSIEL